MIYEKPPPIFTPRRRKERLEDLYIILATVLLFFLPVMLFHIWDWLFPSLGLVPTLTLPALSCDVGP